MKRIHLSIICAGIAIAGFTAWQLLPARGAAPEAPGMQADTKAAPQNVGQNFTVGWTDPNPAGKVTGYKLKYGNTSGTYTTTIDVPGQAPQPPGMKTAPFTNFPLGPEFMVVIAYNASGTQSAPSGELAIVVAEQPLPPGTPVITAGGFAQFNTRAKIGLNNETLITTFSVPTETKVAMRALGPSLPTSLTPVTSTQIDLRNSSGALIESNRGWKNGADASELTALGLAPTNDKESALISTVPAGIYNLTVTSGKSTTGVGQVELVTVP